VKSKGAVSERGKGRTFGQALSEPDSSISIFVEASADHRRTTVNPCLEAWMKLGYSRADAYTMSDYGARYPS